FQCRFCSDMHDTIANVIVCYDSHEEQREALLRAREERRGSKKRTPGPVRRPRGSFPRTGEPLPDAYTLGESVDFDHDDGYDIYGNPIEDDDGYSIDGRWRSPKLRDGVVIEGFGGKLRTDEEGYLVDGEGRPFRKDNSGYFVNGAGGRLKI